MAILFAEFNSATRKRVLIATTGIDKHGRGAGIILFNLQLRESGVVATPCHEAERRRMTCISKQHSTQAAIVAGHCHHRDGVIYRADEQSSFRQQVRDVCFTVVATIDSKGCFAVAELKAGWSQIVQSFADQL